MGRAQARAGCGMAARPDRSLTGAVEQLGDLCAALAAITFEPGSHALVTAGSEARRRYLDWGLFQWNTTATKPSARVAPLHAGAEAAQCPARSAWRRTSSMPGMRNWSRPPNRWTGSAGLHRSPAAAGPVPVRGPLPQLGEGRLAYRPGWRVTSCRWPTPCCLRANGTWRPASRRSGRTGRLAHRHTAAGGKPSRAAKPHRPGLPAGAGRGLRRPAGHWPVFLLDDLTAELDRGHQDACWPACAPAAPRSS